MSGSKILYRNGEVDPVGPFIDRPNGRMDWYRNGRLHRENGPAVESYRNIPSQPVAPVIQHAPASLPANPAPKDTPAPEGTPDERICVVCRENLRNTVLVNCQHNVTCVKCTNQLKNQQNPCPICRASITTTVSYFQS
jgi:hypothetical protein